MKIYPFVTLCWVNNDESMCPNKFCHSMEQYFSHTAQKMRFSIMDFFSKYDQIRRKLWIWSQLLKKCLMENLFFVPS